MKVRLSTNQELISEVSDVPRRGRRRWWISARVAVPQDPAGRVSHNARAEIATVGTLPHIIYLGYARPHNTAKINVKLHTFLSNLYAFASIGTDGTDETLLMLPQGELRL